MSETDRASTPAQNIQNPDAVDFHAAGFLVKVQGSWTGKALEEFRAYLRRKGFSPADEELGGVLERAKKRYFERAACLYLCAERPCRDKIRFDIPTDSDLPVRLTGCQGPCKQAPVVSLRVGQRSEMFAQVFSPADWRAVGGFASRARAAGTLLVDPGEAAPFRFDLVHGPNNGVHLRSLQFLLGHFRGDGRYAAGSYIFQKEVVGTLEAGGRFIALRMDACYPLPDGKKDVHTALVVVGPDGSGNIEASAYLDGGGVRKYAIEIGEGFLSFDDIPPGHARQRARKILKPLPGGFEERLEVDEGRGTFAPYYTIQMRKLGDAY